MKVTHMLRVSAAADDSEQQMATHPLASASTLTAQRLAVAQFALLPLADEDSDTEMGTDVVGIAAGS